MRVFFHKVIVSQSVNKVYTFYVTTSLVALWTKTLQRQSIPQYHKIISLGNFIKVPFRIEYDLPGGLFPLDSPI